MMRKVILLILACFITGCSLFGGNEPLPLYTLNIESFEPTEALSVPLAVDMPLSEVSLNTQRIAVTPSPYQRDYLADGQWPDRLPKVFQEVLLLSLNQRWGGAYVNRVGAGMKAKYVLHTEIQDFSVHYLEGGCPEVRQKILFKVIDLRNRDVLAFHTFSQTIPLYANTMRGIIGAFNRGLHSLFEEALPWMESIFLKESGLNP